jgi:hypothetical protein
VRVLAGLKKLVAESYIQVIEFSIEPKAVLK